MTLFALTTTGYFYEKDKAKKLEGLGFKFNKTWPLDADDCSLTKASGCVTIEINTLDDLLSLAKEHGEIIVGFDKDLPDIEIYDDYREQLLPSPCRVVPNRKVGAVVAFRWGQPATVPKARHPLTPRRSSPAPPPGAACGLIH